MGVLEPSGSSSVPGISWLTAHAMATAYTAAGTSFVYDDASRQVEVGSAALKYGRSGREPIILVPQPSDDPNDPLASSPGLVQTLKTLG